MTKAMLIAAPTSGSGKTSVCRGLVAALAGGGAGRALKVQTFKMGPDYLDPLHLEASSGLACHNLDPWMMGRKACQELFERNTVRAAVRPDLAVVEGAMGLYDGGDPASNVGSSADLAKLLGIPAVLVVDIAGQARSAAFRNMAATATLIAAAALLREESRGGHFRSDFPETRSDMAQRSRLTLDEALALRRTLVEQDA